jgi:hypothetical protein
MFTLRDFKEVDKEIFSGVESKRPKVNYSLPIIYRGKIKKAILLLDGNYISVSLEIGKAPNGLTKVIYKERSFKTATAAALEIKRLRYIYRLSYFKDFKKYSNGAYNYKSLEEIAAAYGLTLKELISGKK